MNAAEKAKQVLKRLESLGTAQNRRVYARHGIAEPLFGVSYANLGKLASEWAGQHEVAMALWASGNHDARVLATRIADPSKMGTREFLAWGRGLSDYVLAEALARLAAENASAATVMKRWLASSSEWTCAAGWSLLSYRLHQGDSLDEQELQSYLGAIEKRIHSAKNRVRHAMNGALIGIGVACPTLRRETLAAAGRIGRIAVDHGQTGCKTPDAAQYIQKALTHLGKKAGGGARASPRRKG